MLALRIGGRLSGLLTPALAGAFTERTRTAHGAVSASFSSAAEPLSTDVPPSRLPTDLTSRLKEVLGGRFTTTNVERSQHGTDESYHACVPPDGVAYAESTEEVSEVVKACAAYKIPVIPYGVGTSIEGHIQAIRGGLAIDTSRMDQIITVNEEDMDCRVQAGVTRKALNEYIKETGLFFPVDPGADASLGGMTATRASGTTTVKYGGMRENVLGVTAVLADGRVLRTGRRVRKSSAGYDLPKLLVGSEGTLGVITEVALKLYGQPEAISSAVCEFDTLQGAVDATVAVMQMGIPVARMELVDDLTIRAVNRYSGTSLRETPQLFFEFHGSEDGVAEAAQTAAELTSESGGLGFKWSTSTEARNELWAARHSAYWASIQMRPNARGFPTDVCVPISQLPACIVEAKARAEAANILAPMVSHSGDGNFHMMMLVDPNDAEEMSRAKKLAHEIVHLAQDMGGTCTGEHGVGIGKLQHLQREHGDVALDVMHAIKMSLDPDNIMNPGKMGSSVEYLDKAIYN